MATKITNTKKSAKSPKSTKSAHVPPPWARLRQMWEAGESYEAMAKATDAHYDPKKPDPTKPGLLLLFILSTVVGWAMPRQTPVTNLQTRWYHPIVIYHGEGVAHNVDIVRHDNITTMSINGAGEADTSYAQRCHFILKAQLPLLLHSDLRSDAFGDSRQPWHSGRAIRILFTTLPAPTDYSG